MCNYNSDVLIRTTKVECFRNLRKTTNIFFFSVIFS